MASSLPELACLHLGAANDCVIWKYSESRDDRFVVGKLTWNNRLSSALFLAYTRSTCIVAKFSLKYSTNHRLQYTCNGAGCTIPEFFLWAYSVSKLCLIWQTSMNILLSPYSRIFCAPCSRWNSKMSHWVPNYLRLQKECEYTSACVSHWAFERVIVVMFVMMRFATIAIRILLADNAGMRSTTCYCSKLWQNWYLPDPNFFDKLKP